VSTHFRPGRLRENSYYQEEEEKTMMMLNTRTRTPDWRENVAPKMASNSKCHGFTAECRKIAVASEKSRPRVGEEWERAAWLLLLLAFRAPGITEKAERKLTWEPIAWYNLRTPGSVPIRDGDVIAVGCAHNDRDVGNVRVDGAQDSGRFIVF
jgi:hypothetical protein